MNDPDEKGGLYSADLVTQEIGGARDRWTNLRRGVILAAGYIAALLFAMLDPFGLSTSSQQSLGRFANWLISRNPNVSRVFVPEHRGPPITVVLIDDNYITSRQSHWPLPYEEWGLLLRKIAEYRPRAVFLDLTFLDRRGGVYRSECVPPAEPLLPMWEGFAKLAPTPIFVGVESLPDLPEGILCELLRDKEGKKWAHVRGVSLQQGNTVRQDVYQLSPLGSDGPPSPAVAIYEELCAAGEHRATALPEDCVRPVPSPSALESRELALIWAVAPDPVTECISPAGASGECRDPLRRGWINGPPGREPCAPESPLYSFVWEGPQDFTSTFCPPLPTISASLLRLDSEKGLARDGLLDPRRRMLSGAVVMIGGSYAGIPDVIDTALHSRLPGVYAHAAALDNLMRYGGDFKAVDEKVVGRLSLNGLYTLMCITILFMFTLAFDRWSRGRRLPDFARWVTVHFLLGMVLVLFGFFALNLPLGVTLSATVFATLPKLAATSFRSRPAEGNRP